MATPDLTQAELESLVAATGDSADKVRKTYEEERAKFPSGGMTQEQFEKMLGMSRSNTANSKIDAGKTLFNIVDHDKSGRISLYEFLLALAALTNNNPEIIFKCVFKLCDANHDDSLTKTELTDVFVLLLEINDSKNTKEKVEKDMDDIKKLVDKVFGDKTQLSEVEFREVFTKNEAVRAIAQGLQLLMLLGFAITAQVTTYGTE